MEKRSAWTYPAPALISEDAIRILRLSSGSWDDEIVCSLKEVSLQAKPEYEAISYTWGGSSEGATICIDGHGGFPVTDNVAAILRRLRFWDSLRTLWIDSICINQQDLAERAQQVKIMGEVYSHASQTLVWLGDSGISLSDREREREDGREDWQVIEGELDRAISKASPWWWDRAWVLQELVLSSKVDVCFGMFRKPWGDFCWDHLKIDSSTERTRNDSTYSLNSAHLNLSPTRKHMRQRFEALDGLRTRITKYGRLPFWDVLRYTIESESTDPRDKVYSILSIVGRGVASLVEPDYERPPEEVFARATFAAVEAEQVFDPLYQIDLTHQRKGSLPSWAVDFTHGHLFDFGLMTRLGDEVKAQWSAQESHGPLAKLRSDLKLLTVSGICFDNIVRTVEITTMLYEERSRTIQRTLVSTLNNLPGLADYDGIISYNAKEPRKKKEAILGPSRAVTDFALKDLTVQQMFREAIALWYNISGVPHNQRADLLHENGLFIFWQYARSSEDKATMFTTKSGFFGVAPDGVKSGDVVVLVRGSKFPVVLRSEGERYRFCGFAFVYGIMNGELLEMCDEALFEETEFTLC